MTHTASKLMLIAGTVVAAPCALAQYDPLHDAPLKRENPVRWRLNTQVDLSWLCAHYEAFNSDGVMMKSAVCLGYGCTGEWGDEFAIEHADMRYPLPGGSAGHAMDPESVRGSFRVQQTELSNESEPLFLGEQQLEYVEFGLRDLAGGERQITLSIDRDMVCFETRYDEARGASIPWPSAPYPDEAASFLLPQRWIENNDARVRDLARDWVGPEGPGGSPALLAKRLAARLLETYTLQGFNWRMWGTDQSELFRRACEQSRTCQLGLSRIDEVTLDAPRLVGFDIFGAAEASELEYVSAFDLTNIYVAVCRAVGIPAKLVIGYDQTEDAIEDSKFLILRPWAEIYLYDEEVEQGWWIPVDVVRQREWSSKAPPVGQAWQFFGNHEHLDETLPIAEAYHPPEGSVDNLVPGLWGWSAGPTQPPMLAFNSLLRFNAYHAPIRSRAP